MVQLRTTTRGSVLLMLKNHIFMLLTTLSTLPFGGPGAPNPRFSSTTESNVTLPHGPASAAQPAQFPRSTPVGTSLQPTMMIGRRTTSPPAGQSARGQSVTLSRR
ncbi:MAG: hypothetical protein J3K34DRAFT_425164 [Monoraphidium minutum]|nr:MAG: hypothetical protein J3K34DRAFT_425164 [Monoraphidium minutum]